MSRAYARRAPDRPFDFVAAERSMAGDDVALTVEERHYCVTVMTRQGFSAEEIAGRLRMSARGVTRVRSTVLALPSMDHDDDPSPVGVPAAQHDVLVQWSRAAAVSVVGEVRDIDPASVWSGLTDLTRDQIQCLVITLAAMVPQDVSPQELLAWTDGLQVAS